MSKRANRWLVWALGVGLLCIAYWVASRAAYLEKLREEDVRVQIKLLGTVRHNRELKEQMDHETRVAQRAVTTRAIEKGISEIRELPFQHPVAYKQISRDELKAYIVSKLGIQYSAEEFKNYEAALQRMGLIPRNLDLMKTVTSLLTEQVAAFYDQDTQDLYTFPEFNLNNNMERMILAHELVHALQDQRFGLLKLPLRAKDNDDLALAASALVEGDATYQMGVYLRQNYNAQEWLGDLNELFIQPMEQIQAAPAYIRDSLLFPYEAGQNFAAALHARGGNAAIDEAFQSPPESSEQILHPEKYCQTPRDRPYPVEFHFKVQGGWKKLQENVVGELGVRSLLCEVLGADKTEKAAEGWGGDRYVVYDTGADRWVLVWETVWDTPRDAREFFNALDELFHQRYKLANAGGAGASVSTDSVFFTVNSQKQNITLFGRTVVLVDVPNGEILDALLQYFSKTKLP